MSGDRMDLIISLWRRISAEQPDLSEHEIVCVISGWLEKSESVIQRYLTEEFEPVPPKNNYKTPLSKLSKKEIFEIIYRSQGSDTGFPPGSVMVGLEGVTGSKNWKKTK